MQENKIIDSIRHWLESFVIELNLCPFAKRELVKGRVRFRHSLAKTEEQLLADVQQELLLLNEDADIETTLIVHPDVLQNFDDYNQFLDLADALIEQLNLWGIYQIASFHPQYQFADTAEDDAENYSNRSPYPLLHLLREASMEREIATYQDVAQIPKRNIELMRKMGKLKLQSILQNCY